jgi:hypothetical protein
MTSASFNELRELWPFHAHMPTRPTDDLQEWEEHVTHLWEWCQSHLGASSWFLYDSYVTNRLVLFTSSLEELTMARMVLA